MLTIKIEEPYEIEVSALTGPRPSRRIRLCVVDQIAAEMQVREDEQVVRKESHNFSMGLAAPNAIADS
jgi:hypothetical protein